MLHDYKVIMINILLRNGVSINRLLNLCEISEKGGIMAAANGDPSKQSLISRQIKELEEELGFALIDRSVKPHTLTQAGKDIEITVRQFQNGMDRQVAHHTKQQEIITIAAGESVILWLLLPIIAKMPKQLQSCIRFKNMQSKQAIDAVISERADLAFHSQVHQNNSLSQKSVSSYQMSVVTKDSTLSSKTSINWSKLPNLPLVHIGGGGSTNELIDKLVTSHPDGPYKFIECTSHNQVLESVQLMDVLGVVPKISSKKAKQLGLKIIDVQEFSEKKYTLTASWKQEKVRQNIPLQELLKKLKLL